MSLIDFVDKDFVGLAVVLIICVPLFCIAWADAHDRKD